jgi:hypothetical protein
MPFQKGNKLGRGGRCSNPGGRPSKKDQQKKKEAAQTARDMLEAEVTPITETYLQIIRHAVDKFLPSVLQAKVEHRSIAKASEALAKDSRGSGLTRRLTALMLGAGWWWKQQQRK